MLNWCQAPICEIKKMRESRSDNLRRSVHNLVLKHRQACTHSAAGVKVECCLCVFFNSLTFRAELAGGENYHQQFVKARALASLPPPVRAAPLLSRCFCQVSVRLPNSERKAGLLLSDRSSSEHNARLFDLCPSGSWIGRFLRKRCHRRWTDGIVLRSPPFV